MLRFRSGFLENESTVSAWQQTVLFSEGNCKKKYIDIYVVSS